jgi:hypothetical protein
MSHCPFTFIPIRKRAAVTSTAWLGSLALRRQFLFYLCLNLL